LSQTPLTAQQQGYLDTLGKSAESLLSLVNNVMEPPGAESGRPGQAGPEPPGEGPGPRAGGPLRILLVEDNVVNQQVLTLLLERAGYRVEVAGNGREALEAFEKRGFDLVLMDLQMPEMDGLRATRLIRAREKAVGGRVPIVAVTANALPGERQRCLAAGMDDYLSKPVRGADLFPAIERLAGQRSRAEPPAAEAPGPPRPDWQANLSGMGFDQEAITRLARTFIDTVPPRLAGLRQALAGGDLRPAQATAHSLKGSLAVFGAVSAIDAAARLEQVGRGLAPEEAGGVLAELEAEVGPLVGSMREYLDGLP